MTVFCDSRRNSPTICPIVALQVELCLIVYNYNLYNACMYAMYSMYGHRTLHVNEPDRTNYVKLIKLCVCACSENLFINFRKLFFLSSNRYELSFRLFIFKLRFVQLQITMATIWLSYGISDFIKVFSYSPITSYFIRINRTILILLVSVPTISHG